MTPEDVRTIVKEEVGQALASYPTKDDLQQALTPYPTKDDLQQALASYATKDDLQQALKSYATKDDLQQALASHPTKDEMQHALQAMKEEIIEAVRDMQTEMLRGLERFSRGNFSRFHAVETAQADVNTRLGLVEERLLAVELRIAPQPPRQ